MDRQPMTASIMSEPARESERLLAWALFELRVLLSPHVRGEEAPRDVRAAAHNLALASLEGGTFTKEQFLAALGRADATTAEQFQNRFYKTFVST